jgi:predicted enzyme related to lactoylglutathione lyase
MSAKTKKTPASVVWFDVPADNLKRAKTFYNKMFGWKINEFRGMKDFLHIDTGGSNESPDGGLMMRKNPQQTCANYIGVPSVDKGIAKVTKLGGKTCVPKTAVPEMGYFAICMDTEGNQFGLWEMNRQAK